MKTLLLKAAAFGAGAALMLCVIGGIGFWYISRPKPIQPWNDKALVAIEPPTFGVSSEDGTYYFRYTVQNNTATDFAADDAQRFRILATVEGGSLSSPIEEKNLVLRLPVFIPSNQKGTITLRFKGLKAPEQKASESDDAYHERLRIYLNESVPSVQNFVLFDNSNRCRVNLPKWAVNKPENKPGKN